MTRASVGLAMIPVLLASSFNSGIAAAPEPKAAELAPVALKDLNLQRGWFKPMPAKDGDPICGTLATDVRRYFRSTGEWSQYAAADIAADTGLMRVPRPTPSSSTQVTELRELPSEPQQLILERPNQPRLFLYFIAAAECDTCSGERLMLADQRIAHGESALPNAVQTPAASAWTLYRSASGVWYVAGIVDQHLQLYALTSPQQWRLTCDMALAPYRLRQSLDPAARTALTAMDALHSAARSLGGEAQASCGRKFGADTLEPALYRPWQWLEETRRENYRLLLTQMEEKATADTGERAALDHYNVQLSASIDAVQRFYVQKFGWNTQIATRVAYDALTGAIGSALRPIAAGSQGGCR